MSKLIAFGLVSAILVGPINNALAANATTVTVNNVAGRQGSSAVLKGKLAKSAGNTPLSGKVLILYPFRGRDSWQRTLSPLNP